MHKHCCLSPKNAHGSGRAVNLLYFTLLLNLTTAVLLQGNPAWMSVGVAQQSRGIEEWVYYTALVDDTLDSDQRIHILSVLPYHYWFFKKILYTFPQPPFLPSGWLVHLNKNLSETRWLIIYCFEKGKKLNIHLSLEHRPAVTVLSFLDTVRRMSTMRLSSSKRESGELDVSRNTHQAQMSENSQAVQRIHLWTVPHQKKEEKKLDKLTATGWEAGAGRLRATMKVLTNPCLYTGSYRQKQKPPTNCLSSCCKKKEGMNSTEYNLSGWFIKELVRELQMLRLMLAFWNCEV